MRLVATRCRRATSSRASAAAGWSTTPAGPSSTVALARPSKDGELVKAGCIGWFFGMFPAANALSRLARVPRFLGRTTELLDDGEVTPRAERAST